MTNGTLGGTEIGKSWEALTLDFSPTTLPDTADAAPTTTTRRLTDAYLCQFGDPLREELLLVRCRQCSKPILPQSFAEHSGIEAAYI
jgi:hypothetical protein